MKRAPKRLTGITTRLVRLASDEWYAPYARQPGYSKYFEFPITTLHTDEGVEGYISDYCPLGQGRGSGEVDGAGFPLMLDSSAILSFDEALRIGCELDDLDDLDDLDYEWFEGPLPDRHLLQLTRLSQQIRTPVLAAETVGLLESVEPGSPAERASLEGGDLEMTIAGSDFRLVGDIITVLNGKRFDWPETIRYTDRHPRA